MNCKTGWTLAYIFKKITLISTYAILSVFFSCKKENHPPEAKLEVTPLSGEAPLQVSMKLTGDDPDGIGDINQYILNIGSEKVTSKTPIDITRTFDINRDFNNSETIKVFGEVIDSKNQSNKTDVSSVEVFSGPYLEQSASLINYAEINYSATLYKMDNAELKVNKNGILLLTEQIKDINLSGADYYKTFNYTNNGFTKGNYEFDLKSDTLEKKTSVEIQNYKPTSTLGSINIVLNEEADSTITLPTPTDKNPEDNPVSINSAMSLDGKTELTITGYKLKIKALANKTGNYQVQLEFGSEIGGIEKAVLQGNIIKDTRIKINPFIQPNDSTLNWYGSGDVTNDNIVNGEDLTRLNEIIAGTYSNPSDKRLNDRADVNGDGIVNNQDKQLLENKLNGLIIYLPGEWNKLTTRAEREDWLRKMLAIDKTNEIVSSPDWDCTRYDEQTYINFHGISNSTDISRFLESYLYDFSNNGRFNLPLLDVFLVCYNSEGKFMYGHAMPTIVLNDNALYWNDLCNIESETDQINVQPGQAYLDGTNSEFVIRELPTMPKSGRGVSLTEYILYTIKNNTPSEGTLLQEHNPDVKIITQRSN